VGRIFLEQQGCGVLTRDGGLVESKEDGVEECGGLLFWVYLQLRLDIDDECQADGREQTSLIRKVDNDCFLPFPDLFVREGGEQE